MYFTAGLIGVGGNSEDGVPVEVEVKEAVSSKIAVGESVLGYVEEE